MADISTQLQTIENNAYGDNVLAAISSALTAVSGDTDISTELYLITNGRYGSDIRMAIHDALYKISQGGGGSQADSLGIGNTYGYSRYVEEQVVGQPSHYIPPSTILITLSANDLKNHYADFLQFSELHFYDENQNLINFEDRNTTIESSVPGNVWQGVAQSIDLAIDNNVNTKYCGAWSQVPIIVTIVCTYTGNIGYFSYTTADDTPGRDMITFTIDVEKPGGLRPYRVLSVENATITDSRKTETQLFQCTIP